MARQIAQEIGQMSPSNDLFRLATKASPLNIDCYHPRRSCGDALRGGRQRLGRSRDALSLLRRRLGDRRADADRMCVPLHQRRPGFRSVSRECLQVRSCCATSARSFASRASGRGDLAPLSLRAGLAALPASRGRQGFERGISDSPVLPRFRDSRSSFAMTLRRPGHCRGVARA